MDWKTLIPWLKKDPKPGVVITIPLSSKKYALVNMNVVTQCNLCEKTGLYAWGSVETEDWELSGHMADWYTDRYSSRTCKECQISLAVQYEE